ncbi:MAG: glycosyltransferase, partial [Candidatus Hydrogenedentota bacterium]
CGRPSILVPFPHATGDHQTANAKAFVDAGAAAMIRDANIEKELYAALMELMADCPRRVAMAERARSQARPDAAIRIVDILEELVR